MLIVKGRFSDSVDRDEIWTCVIPNAMVRFSSFEDICSESAGANLLFPQNPVRIKATMSVDWSEKGIARK